MAGAMVQHMLECLDERQALTPGSAVVEAYCGVGLFSAFLAPRVSQLTGIEASPFAAEDFVLNLDEFDNVTLYEAEAEAALPQLEERPNVVILDPPRQGVARQAMDGLLRLGAPLLVYVSCDPATLARDGKRLQAGGYRLEEVTPFDLFPQTYHIESISLWSRG
jgi:23S rRNA (uracil1939-C5)-methyltransferase